MDDPDENEREKTGTDKLSDGEVRADCGGGSADAGE